MQEQFGKLLIIFGGLVVLVGILLLLFDKVPFLGKFPGDVYFKRGNFTLFFPIVSCLVISIVLTILLNLFKK